MKFSTNTDLNRKWVGEIASSLTSALQQHQTSLDYKSSGNEHLYTGFMLSYSGYKALGVEEDEIPDDKAFRAGMKNLTFRYDTGPGGVHKRTINPLNDDPSQWEDSFKHSIDAVLILAYGSDHSDTEACETYLSNKINEIKNQLGNSASIVSIEKGYVLKNKNNDTIEHFGFVDGISNPVFFNTDFEKIKQEQGVENFDPSAPFGLVAVNDPGGKNPDTSFGSYVVYRKMQQNIKGFKDQSKQFASILSNSTGFKIEDDFTQALIFGRTKEGGALTAQIKKENLSINSFNNFDYQEDTEGLKCPFHSHIRKTNPRGDTNRISKTPLSSERSRRIVRRGISYGSKDLNPSKEWTDAGLLFISYQSDIEQQFLVMQCGWADNPNFVNENTGHDPITGDQNQKIAPSSSTNHWKLEIHGKTTSTDFRYKDLIKIKGGEYFFTPSISFCMKFKNK